MKSRDLRFSYSHIDSSLPTGRQALPSVGRNDKRGSFTAFLYSLKVYICDSGLARHLSRCSEGNLFENTIFWGLQQNKEIKYYRRKNGPEIDFIVEQKIAYEVKIIATQRDVIHLERNAKTLGFKKHYVVSQAYTPLKGVVYGFMIE